MTTNPSWKTWERPRLSSPKIAMARVAPCWLVMMGRRSGSSSWLECLLITGQQSDYQLKVVIRDMDAYQDLLLNKITRIQGVTGVHTSFVLRKVIDRTALPA